MARRRLLLVGTEALYKRRQHMYAPWVERRPAVDGGDGRICGVRPVQGDDGVLIVPFDIAQGGAAEVLRLMR